MRRPFLVLLLLTIVFSGIVLGFTDEPALKRWYASNVQGTQAIDSSLSFANNLRVTETALFVRADKAKPNVFTAKSDGDSNFDFYLYASSLLNDETTYPFFSFDVVAMGEHEYVIGPTFGTVEDEIPLGLPLQVAVVGPGGRSSPLYTQLKNIFLYSIVIDKSRSSDSTLYFYATGWKYTTDGDTPGLVAIRGKAFISGDPSIVVQESDIYLINQNCYDVWTETTAPKMYISSDSNSLIIGVTGRCNGVYKISIPPVTAEFNHAPITSSIPSYDASADFNGIAYSKKDNLVIISSKKYNRENITFSFVNISQDTLGQPVQIPGLEQPINETTPVIAIDESDGSLIIVTSGFNTIMKYSFINDIVTFAVLPDKFKLVSDMLVWGNYIYLSTYESNAQVLRISSQNFCPQFCSGYGYCSGGECVCGEGYEQDPTSNTPMCLPTHLVKEIDKLLFNSGTATTFGILFIFTFLGASSGWFIWYRKYQELK